MADKNKELERLEKQLFQDETVKVESLRNIRRENAEPAFDDPDKIYDPETPLTYQNYANAYGEKEKKLQEERRMEQKRKKDDRTIVALMLTACGLCLGIIGVLAYWLVVLL